MTMTFEVAIMSFVANALVFVFLSWIITRRVNRKKDLKELFEYLGLKKDIQLVSHVKTGLIFALLMPFIQLVSMTIFGFVGSSLVDGGVTEVLRGYYGTIVNAPIGQVGLMGKIILALCMIVFVGFGEEVFFRGMIQRGAIAKFGNKAGLLITAFVFTLMHGFYLLPLPIAIASGSSLFIISLVFGTLKERTGSLIPSIIAHGVGNALVYTTTAHLFYNLLG